MPDNRIEEIKRALEAAEIGPWAKVEFANGTTDIWQAIDNTGIARVFGNNETAADNAHLIANAPEWLRYLLEQNELLRSSKADVEHNRRLLSEEKQQLLQQNEQQQAEIEKQTSGFEAAMKEVKQLREHLRESIYLNLHEERMSEVQEQLQQSREEKKVLEHATQILKDRMNDEIDILKMENERLLFDNKMTKAELKSVENLGFKYQRENERLRGELERYEERRQTAAIEVGKLFDELEQIKAERDDYRKELEWYASNNMLIGKRARDILSRYTDPASK